MGALETIASETYVALGQDPSIPLRPTQLAARMLGDGSIVRVPRPLGQSRGMLLSRAGLRRIAILDDMAPDYVMHVIAHELAHVVLEQRGYRVDRLTLEEHCDYLGGALMAPREAVTRFCQQHGPDLPELADACCANETWAALRIGEATHRPVWVVSPEKVRFRGTPPSVAHDDLTVRVWAKEPRPGLAKVRLTDAPDRIALLQTG